MAVLLQKAGTVRVLGIHLPVTLEDGKIEVRSIDISILLEEAGRTAYRSEDKITDDSAKKFVDKLAYKLRHHSVVEHSAVTIRFQKISRGFSHELVRQRVSRQHKVEETNLIEDVIDTFTQVSSMAVELSITQESTRYVDYMFTEPDGKLDKAQLHIVMPPFKNLDEEILIEIDRRCVECYALGAGDFWEPVTGRWRLRLKVEDVANLYESIYKSFRGLGWKPQDVRQWLPIGVCTEVVLTTNLRDWLNMCILRCAKNAHWEMREVFCHQVLPQLKVISPVLFDPFEVKYDENEVPYAFSTKSVDYIILNLQKDLEEMRKEYEEKINEKQQVIDRLLREKGDLS